MATMSPLLRRMIEDMTADRLVHRAMILQMNVESYRRKAALKRKRGSSG
jgi:hypothetical protein